MFNLPAELSALDSPITVGIIGAGFFGTKLADQIESTTGMTVAGIADIDLETARATYAEAGVDDPLAEPNSIEAVTAAIDGGDPPRNR